MLTKGLPTVIYVGGEFCPYCAAERWALTAALSRFGTFTGLQTTRSAATDGNFATLSFATADFSSPYLAFSGTEQEDRARKLIRNPPAAELASFQKYSGGGYPYLSINQAYQAGGAQYDVELLKGLTAEQVAADVQNPSSALGGSILASANVLTAGMCRETGGMPAAVCSAGEVKAADGLLNAKGGSSGSTSSG